MEVTGAVFFSVRLITFERGWDATPRGEAKRLRQEGVV